MFPKRIIVAFALLLLAPVALAEWESLLGRPAPALSIESWTAAPEGETLADLRGRAVVLLLGGVGDAVRWNDLRAAYWVKGLRIVVISPEGEADAPSGAEFSIAVGGFAGYGDGEAPRAVLVGPDGKVGWEGAPADLKDAVVAAHLKKAKKLYLRGVCAEVKPAATAFRKGQVGKAVALAGEVPLAEGVSDEAVTDASYVAARAAALLLYWQRQADRALSAGNHAESKACLESIKKHFSGSEDASVAAAKLKALKADASAQKEVLAAAEYVRLRAELLRAGAKEKKIAALVKKLARFVERRAGTKGAERAARLLDSIRSDPAVTAIEAFIAKMKIDTRSSGWRTSLPKPPQVPFSAGKSYFWNLETNKGPMKLRFFPEVAPMHVSSTIYLTTLGYYDGLIFHRVIPGFMAQGGCPDGDGRGGPGYRYGGELDPQEKHDRPGILSMAHSGPGTDGSQFFITFGPASHLDMKHTVFGVIVEGMETLRKLEKLGSSGGATKEKLILEKATISTE